jgi:hypothetical protein
MPLSNQRFVTTWTSEDSIQWRMYIIPSSVNYITGGTSTNVTLPPEFLLRDMALETELGSIPAGLVSQVLKINVNIAALQGTTALDDLREELLRGTTAKRYARNADGSRFLNGLLPNSVVQYDAFNTFVLQYNDGSGYKTAFIGCQKYSAENELEITALDNVITFAIEIFDIHRCIGELITEDVWKMALRCNSDVVEYAADISQAENTEMRSIYVGKYNQDQYNSQKLFAGVWAIDELPGDFYMYISTFARLKTKIGAMYSAYLRSQVQNLSASFVGHDMFLHTFNFPSVTHEYRSYIAEIWGPQEGGTTLLSGAHADPLMFAQFNNFHEVYRMLSENALETVRSTYSFTAGNPDTYTVTMVSSNPYPFTSQMTFDEDNTYGNLKIKMFSETLNQVNVAVTSIKGEQDTESFEYGSQGTSGDNSKDVKIMFHNVPLLTNRKFYGGKEIAFLEDGTPSGIYGIPYYHRSTVNSGTMLYFSTGNNDFEKQKPIVKRIDPLMSVFFGGEDVALEYTNTLTSNIPLQIISEQQKACLPQNMAYAMVNFLGRPKQAEATLTSTFTTVKTTDVGQRCTIDLSDYNTLLESIYGAPTALSVITKHTHKVYEGMCDITLRIDAEPE